MRLPDLRMMLTGLLVALMATTGLGLSMARGASAATGQMVICAGGVTATIWIDAEGQPVDAPRICPDAQVLLTDTSGPVELRHAPVVVDMPGGIDAAVALVSAPRPEPHSRGPPPIV